jgi:hypothetical protein
VGIKTAGETPALRNPDWRLFISGLLLIQEFLGILLRRYPAGCLGIAGQFSSLLAFAETRRRDAGATNQD